MPKNGSLERKTNCLTTLTQGGQTSTGQTCGQVLLDAPENNAEKKALKELYVDGTVTEDKAVWTEELQTHCEEVGDEEETAEKQKERMG